MATQPAEDSTGASPRSGRIDSRSAAGFGPAASSTTGSSAASHQETTDDLRVVDAILRGERDAFRILVDRESASVVRACFRVLSDLEEAEDVAQEAFVTAYRALSTWRGEGPFGALVTRIAIRLAVRQLAKRRAVTWVRPAIDGTVAETVASIPAPLQTHPEHEALRAERMHATRRAVADLEEPYRETVALRFFGERSLEEISELTGRNLNTVKTHLRRGLLKLRDRVEPGGPA